MALLSTDLTPPARWPGVGSAVQLICAFFAIDAPRLALCQDQLVFGKLFSVFLVSMYVTDFAAGPATAGVHAHEKLVNRLAIFFAHPAPQPGVLGSGHCGSCSRNWCQHRNLLRRQRRHPASATL